MRKVECPELCPDCPVRKYVPDEPVYLEEVGELPIPQIDNSGRGGAVISIDFEHGRVVGPRLVKVDIMSEGAQDGAFFWAKGHDWDSGEVEQAFEECDKPETVRSGFLWLNKRFVCAALKKVAQER